MRRARAAGLRPLLAALLGAAAGLALAYPSGADVAEIHATISREAGSPCRATSAALLERPVELAFLDLVVLGEDVVQQARLTDRRGNVWVAYYAMQRRHEGGWRVSGCRLVAPAKSIPA